MSDAMRIAAAPSHSQAAEVRHLCDEGNEKRSFPLPTDLVLHLFSFLELRTLNTCSHVNRELRRLSDHERLWSAVFQKTDLSQLKTPFPCPSGPWKYRSISVILARFGRFGAAIAACEESAKLHRENGAYGFKELCQMACDVKNDPIAIKCQQRAKRYHVVAGNEARRDFIKSKINDLDFLENAEKLVPLAVDLVDEDREFGLQALMAIAKKCAELQAFAKAMDYTERAQTLRDSKSCRREREQRLDILPWVLMGEHMLTLKQYTWAERCAKKLGRGQAALINAKVIVGQATTENFFNASLFATMQPGTAPWRLATEGLILGLIAHGRYAEARMIVALRLERKREGDPREPASISQLDTALSDKLAALPDTEIAGREAIRSIQAMLIPDDVAAAMRTLQEWQEKNP